MVSVDDRDALDRAFERRMAGHDNDLRFAFARHCIAQQLEAVTVGQDQVEQDHVRCGAQKIARTLQRIGAGGGETVIRDEFRQRFRGVGVVVDDQCMRHFRKEWRRSSSRSSSE